MAAPRNAPLVRTGIPVLLCLALLAGCTRQRETMAAACLDEPASILRALVRAPGTVVLADGTRLSQCVSSARTDGDLQSLGIVLARVADALRAQARADRAAALRLGYLAGAVRNGAASASSGIADQLARRVEQLATLDADADADADAGALRRGRRAGELRG